jgi:hypothetical protein
LYKLYIHTNLENNKKYIGITSQKKLNDRFLDGKGYIKNTEFWNDIQKYGWFSGFTHEVIMENMTKEEACKKEIEYISKFKTTNPDFGYNKSEGGDVDSGYSVTFCRINPFNENDFKIYTNVYMASKETGINLEYIKNMIDNVVDFDSLYKYIFENKDFLNSYIFIKKSLLTYVSREISNYLRFISGLNFETEEFFEALKYLRRLDDALKLSREEIKKTIKDKKDSGSSIERSIRIIMGKFMSFNYDELNFFLENKNIFQGHKNYVFYSKLGKYELKYYKKHPEKVKERIYPKVFISSNEYEDKAIEDLYFEMLGKNKYVGGLYMHMLDFKLYRKYLLSLRGYERKPDSKIPSNINDLSQN